MSNTHIDYDICIIGAGISGLYCARELSKAWPDASICILEKYEFIGGRVSTFKKIMKGTGSIQWEAGAGRIHKSHTQTLELLREYGIELIPIPPGIEWRSALGTEPVEFGRYIQNLGINTIAGEHLSKKTIHQIIHHLFGRARAAKLTDRYEYRSEIDTLRADKAISAILHELGHQEGFSVVRGGFSLLVKALKEDVQKRGVKILRKMEVSDIHKIDKGYRVFVKDHIDIKASKVIVTIPRDAVAQIKCFKNLPILKKVTMRPLVRMYAVFPTRNGSWFEGIHKFICEPPVRYVIPMDPTKGSIMISYTDGKDAEYWLTRMKQDGKSIQNEVMKQTRSLFPSLEIPEPTYFKIHAWSDGCSYWAPGTYSIEKVSMDSIVPLPKEMPEVYMANESWAEDQCWVNSALVQSTKALKVILNQ